MYKIACRCILSALGILLLAFMFKESKLVQSFIWFYPMVILAALGLVFLIVAFFKGEFYGESLFFPIILLLVSLGILGYSFLLLFCLSMALRA